MGNIAQQIIACQSNWFEFVDVNLADIFALEFDINLIQWKRNFNVLIEELSNFRLSNAS